jgi:alpha-glucosidase (family GH31 glycosyl hydrolase)
VYLPAGRWFELHSGAIFDGPTTITASATLAALPIYVREGAVIPSSEQGALVLDVYPSFRPAPAPSRFVLFEDDG